MEEIINQLLSHDISKHEALSRIRGITDGLRKKSAIEMNVESVSYSVNSNHGYIKLKIPYGYSKISEINTGNKVDVILVR